MFFSIRRFVLSGSSARKLRRGGANLLAGRARTVQMHPLSARELGGRFDLLHSPRYGHLPAAYVESDPGRFLKSYVGTYLSEEVQQESLVRSSARTIPRPRCTTSTGGQRRYRVGRIDVVPLEEALPTLRARLT